MLFQCVVICVVLATLAQNLVLALPTDSGNGFDVRIGFTVPRNNPWDQGHILNLITNGAIYTCNLGPRIKPVRDDYKYAPGIGWHKLHTTAATWNVARKTCNEEGGHLAIVNSNAEADVLRDIFERVGKLRNTTQCHEAYVGIHDLYAEGDWVTVLGDSLAKTGYATWTDDWNGQPDNAGSGQHCGAANCGAFLKKGGFDDVYCDKPLAFFCELPF